MKQIAIALLLMVSCQLFASEQKELECLAQNIYFEARDQEFVGQVAVAFVTLNRVNSWRYRDSICGVVRGGYVPNRRDCHFSWFCDGESDVPLEKDAWETSVIIARTVLQDYEYIEDPTNGATHYHALYVKPWWSSKLNHLATIGDHIFYE